MPAKAKSIANCCFYYGLSCFMHHNLNTVRICGSKFSIYMAGGITYVD